jgi:hypothetical protein
MTHVEPGVLGAYRASWRKANPRELIMRIMKENPSADEITLRKLFWREVKNDEDHQRALSEYFLDHVFKSLHDSESRKRSSEQAKEAASAARERAHNVKRQLKARVQEEAKLILLDLLMPNGKTLRNCTGADCESFGGWFARLAKHVPAKELVGDVLNERDVRKLWQRTV